MAARAAKAPFPVGGKELYLPRIFISLKRTPRLPPTAAKFTVPLWFSKLDLRDYLFHVYNVRTLAIRSMVHQQRIREGNPTNPRPQPQRWHRPRSRKEMVAELERPFVWPDTPEDLTPWGREEKVEMEREQERKMEENTTTADARVDWEDRGKMREQARALLEGREKWKPMEGERRYGVRLGGR